MAAIRKGCQVSTFPPLRSAAGELVNDPTLKADVLKACFFPPICATIEASQPDDPAPLPTRQWEPISITEVSRALSGASAKSAPGPSGVGYTLLKWAHAAHPEILPDIFNLSLDAGTHPWHHATVIVLNKPNKPDYSNLKAYRPISLLKCIGKVFEKIITKCFN